MSKITIQSIIERANQTVDEINQRFEAEQKAKKDFALRNVKENLERMIAEFDLLYPQITLSALKKLVDEGRTEFNLPIKDSIFVMLSKDPIDAIEGQSYNHIYGRDFLDKSFNFINIKPIKSKTFQQIKKLAKGGISVWFDSGMRDSGKRDDGPDYYREKSPSVRFTFAKKNS